MPTTEVVPASDVEIVGADTEPWDDPCPVCGDRWDRGPERDRWGRQHCWHCGYTPGQAVLAMPGAPQQPDWAKLVNDAVRNALTSDAQVLAVAMTNALGPEGMAELARQQQERLGMAQPATAAASADDEGKKQGKG